MKKIILTADDLGINKETNKAIEEAYKKGTLTSACIMTNMDCFVDALQVIKNCPNLDIGIHLNIIEGYALLKEKNPLCDKSGKFNNSYLKILLNSHNKKYMEYIEKEFTLQIEKLLKIGLKPSFINSHVHTHAIPEVFKLTCELARKYNIKAIRTQDEIFYIAPDKNHFKILYFINIIKHFLLKIFTLVNKNTLKSYNIKTNANFIGVLYTLNMDENSIISGLKKVKNNSEIILHPTTDPLKRDKYIEYRTLTDKNFIEKLKKEDVKLVKFKDL